MKPRVLFVEDEASIYEPFSKALAREGFEPVVARTASRPLQLAEDGDFAIVLLDLTLPDGATSAERRGAARRSRSSCSPRAVPRRTRSSVSSSATTTPVTAAVTTTIEARTMGTRNDHAGRRPLAAPRT